MQHSLTLIYSFISHHITPFLAASNTQTHNPSIHSTLNTASYYTHLYHNPCILFPTHTHTFIQSPLITLHPCWLLYNTETKTHNSCIHTAFFTVLHLNNYPCMLLPTHINTFIQSPIITLHSCWLLYNTQTQTHHIRIHTAFITVLHLNHNPCMLLPIKTFTHTFNSLHYIIHISSSTSHSLSLAPSTHTLVHPFISHPTASYTSHPHFLHAPPPPPQ